MDPTVTTGIFSQIAQQGIVFGLLLVIIGGLIWERKRMLSEQKDLSNLMITTLRESGEKYADVVEKNTEAFTQLKETINVLKINNGG